MSLEDFIKHYGIKGMKWGIRRERGPDGLVIDGRARTRFKEAPKSLDDKTLQQRIQRMSLEVQYNKLNSKDVSEGQRFTKELLMASGRKALVPAAAGVSLYAIKKGVEKKFGKDVAAAIPDLKK